MTRITSAIVMAFVLFFASIQAASAADELQLSDDHGDIWSGSVSDPLFIPPDRWVPGDNERRSFWVRNNSGDTGSLVVEAVGLNKSLYKTGDVTVRIRKGAGPWTTLDADHTKVTDTLAAGADREFEVNVHFLEASTNETQNEIFPLSFNVQLSGDGGAIGPGDDTKPDDSAAVPSGDLPQSGSTISTPLLIGSILAVLLGAAMLFWARRRKPGDDS